MPKYLLRPRTPNPARRASSRMAAPSVPKPSVRRLPASAVTLEAPIGPSARRIHRHLRPPEQRRGGRVSLTVAATGAVGSKTTVLMSAAEVDEAVKLHPSYRAPGA